jgi:cytochrome c-type biogenesis protein CcmH/NrfG
VRAERAEALLQLGRLDEATAAARESLRLYGDQILPHWVLALIAERRGAWQEARDEFQTILARLEPGDARVPAVRSRLNTVERNLNGKDIR